MVASTACFCLTGGGQFTPKSPGQSFAELTGQFTPKSGGQYLRNLQAPYTVKVTLLDQPGEANRANPSVIATQGASSVFFNGVKDGQAHDYLITITNATGGEVGTIKILNRKCP